MKKKVVFVTSHPIQYQVPVFRRLAAMQDVDFEAWYAIIPDGVAQGAGFGVEFQWDLPLLEGYRYRVLKNASRHPAVERFMGCDTPGIYEWLRSARPDAVIVNGWVVKSCLQALWACKQFDIPCLVRGEANDLRERPVWKQRAQRLLVNRYDACLYIGAANRAFYKARGVASDRLHPSLYCIENDRFFNNSKALEAERGAIRRRWEIPNDRSCYLFCGKFEPKKHTLELLHAFQRALRENENLHLLMVGEGALKAACKAFVDAHELPVTFTGFLNQTEITQAYVAADCLVLPSDAGETWGLVVNEAMASGRPALVSNLVGCAEDLVERQVTGDYFAFGDWSALTDQLIHYGSKPGLLRAMGADARLRIQAYSPEAAAEGLHEAVVDVLKRRRSSVH